MNKREKHKRQICEYRGGACALCGRTVEEQIARRGKVGRVFEFHHVDPSSKHPNYKNLIQRTISTEQLDELDKCVLLCSSCHGDIEDNGMDCEMLIAVEHLGRRAEQRIKGQIITDLKGNSHQFVTNEILLICPYFITFDGQMRRVMFGNELKNKLGDFVKNIRVLKKILVTDLQYRWQFFAEQIEADEVRIQHDVTFPVLSAEFNDIKNRKALAWVRNGRFLHRDGPTASQGMMTYSVIIESSPITLS